MMSRALVVLVSLAVACSGGQGPATAPDAAGPDAAMLDAPTDTAAVDAVDAPTDAVAIDTPAAWDDLIVVRAVDLQGYDTFVPHAGRRVVFVGPDGAVTDTTTNTDGLAFGPGVPDTTVFVVRFGSYLHVFTAVGPGTIIDVAPPPWTRFSSFQPLSPIRFRFPSSPAGTLDAIAGSCSPFVRAETPPAPVRLEPRTDCTFRHGATVLGVRRNGPVAVGWSALTGVDLVASQGQTLDLPPLQPLPTVPVRYLGIPAGAALAPAPRPRGLDFQVETSAPSVPHGGATADVSVPFLPLGPARLHTYVNEPLPPGTTWWTAIEHLQPLATLTGAVDLTGPLARLRDVRYGPDVALRWAWTGNVAHEPDLVTFRITYRRADGLNGHADLYGPGDRDALIVPHWPAPLAHLAPVTIQHAGPPTIFDPIDRPDYRAALRDAYFDDVSGLPTATPYPDEPVWRGTHLDLTPAPFP